MLTHLDSIYRPINTKKYMKSRDILLTLPLLTIAIAALLSSCNTSTKVYSIELYTTNDLHGNIFSLPYSDLDSSSSSLANVSEYINNARLENGKEGVVLIDLGDNLQGDNATYYFNFVDTLRETHLLSDIFNYMEYDAVVVGNHDIEAGHQIYDRMKKELKMPYLAANTIDTKTNKPYFDEYVILKKGEIKIAIIGLTNSNIKKWISEYKYEGMDFVEYYPFVDSLVSVVKKGASPDLIFIAIHSGFGTPDKPDIENCSSFLASKVKGIDGVLAAHDHKAMIEKVFNGEDSVVVIEGGNRAKYLSNLSIKIVKKGGEMVEKTIEPKIIDLSSVREDSLYIQRFADDFNLVKSFSNKQIGRLIEDIDFSKSLDGMSDYLSLIHLVQLYSTNADISFSAPLLLKQVVKKGTLTYNDLFSLYKFENMLYVVKMSGREIINYLEESYDHWIKREGFYYNYDSAGGIIYTVDRSKGKGERVQIKSMGDGTPFDINTKYNVAITSYRTSGAGGLIEAAGMDPSKISERLVAEYPEIRELIYKYILKEGDIDPKKFIKYKKLGYWNFVK